jgi:hypothetical protein
MNERTPRFDGLYVLPGNGYANYLRFNPEGKVSNISATGGIEDFSGIFAVGIFAGLTPNDPDAGQGTYTIDNGNLRFSTITKHGQVNFEGRIVGDRATELHLHVHSQINGSRRDEVYRFTQTARGTGRGSVGRCSIGGKAAGRLYIGPLVRRIDTDYWPVINFCVSDGKETISVDVPIEAARPIITEMQEIIKEYDDGTEVPPNWDVPS